VKIEASAPQTGNWQLLNPVPVLNGKAALTSGDGWIIAGGCLCHQLMSSPLEFLIGQRNVAKGCLARFSRASLLLEPPIIEQIATIDSSLSPKARGHSIREFLRTASDIPGPKSSGQNA